MRKVYKYNQPDTQFGFRNGVSTQDATYVAQTETMPCTWTACVINLRVAFDHICQAIMKTVMKTKLLTMWRISCGSYRGALLWFTLSNTVRYFRGLAFECTWTWRDWGISKIQAS